MTRDKKVTEKISRKKIKTYQSYLKVTKTSNTRNKFKTRENKTYLTKNENRSHDPKSQTQKAKLGPVLHMSLPSIRTVCKKHRVIGITSIKSTSKYFTSCFYASLLVCDKTSFKFYATLRR